MATPTTETYNSLEEAYNFFNEFLFENRLPECLITLQRKGKHSLGFFCPGKFESIEGKPSDELAMNPVHFAARDLIDTLSTLVHEMTHVEQQHFGKPGRRGYHNKAWGLLMKRVGLHPSNSGKPGGKETGQQMTHYIVERGQFEMHCNKLIKQGFLLRWADAESKKKDFEVGVNPDSPDKPKAVNRSNRIKFTCHKCQAQAWGKPSLKVVCGMCRTDMHPR